MGDSIRSTLGIFVSSWLRDSSPVQVDVSSYASIQTGGYDRRKAMHSCPLTSVRRYSVP